MQDLTPALIADCIRQGAAFSGHLMVAHRRILRLPAAHRALLAQADVLLSLRLALTNTAAERQMRQSLSRKISRAQAVHASKSLGDLRHSPAKPSRIMDTSAGVVLRTEGMG